MDKKKTTPPQTNSKKVAKTNSNIKISTVITLLMGIVLMACFAYLWQQVRQNQQQTKMVAQKITQQLSHNQQQLGDFQRSVTDIKTAQVTQSKNLRNAQASLQKLKSMNGRNHSAWVLAEAEYLAKLANYNINFEKNVPVAIRLLQTADENIAALDSPQLTPVRRTLADDIAALQAVPKIDITGILLRINALNTQVDQLPLVETQSNQILATKQTKAPQQTSSWKENLKATWQQLKSLVVIQNKNTDIKPLVSVEQHTYLLQNLHILLNQTQWAVMHDNQTIYQHSLNNALQLLHKYFDNNDATTKHLITALQQLQGINITPKIPGIADSESSIKQAIHDNLLNQASEIENNKQPKPTINNVTKQTPTTPAPAPKPEQKQKPAPKKSVAPKLEATPL